MHRVKYEFSLSEERVGYIKHGFEKSKIETTIKKVKETKSLIIVIERDKELIDISNEVLKSVDNIKSLLIRINRSKFKPDTLDWDKIRTYKNTLIDFCTDVNQNDIDLSFLNSASQLEHLNLLKIQNLSFLKDMSKLKTLVLRNNCIKYSHFENKLDLRYLELDSWSFNRDIDFPSLPKLGYVNLTYIKEKDIDFVSTCENLQILEIYGGALEVFPDLSKCTKLTHIYVNSCTKLKDVSGLLKCPNLKSLHFCANAPKIKYEDMKGIVNIPSLTRRWIFLATAKQNELLWKEYPNEKHFDNGEISFEVI